MRGDNAAPRGAEAPARESGLFGYLLDDERLSALAWSGATPIMAAIVAVERLGRLRPPRPLPEG